MRGLYIIVEGPTEEEFIRSVAAPYFHNAGIYDVRPIVMTTSKGHRGGDVSYGRLKTNVELLLKSEADILVSSFIDFFRLRTDFPKYIEAQAIGDKMARVQFLESAIGDEILQHRFVPYIQLHEFEGLLFSSKAGFANIPGITAAAQRELDITINQYENPELLNDGADTAPSKRMMRIVPNYQKVLMGNYIAMDITLAVIRQRCVRFRNWMDMLIQRMKD